MMKATCQLQMTKIELPQRPQITAEKIDKFEKPNYKEWYKRSLGYKTKKISYIKDPGTFWSTGGILPRKTVFKKIF